MTRLLRLAAALAVLAAGGSAAAQERPNLGLGISIVPLEARGAIPTVEVYVPLMIAPNFRLEPSLGIFTFDSARSLSPSSPPASRTEMSNITLGVGAFLMNRIAPQADMYVGGRLKLNFASRDDGVVDDSDTDVVLAGAVGGEYYLVPKFSIGMEAQLGLYSLGDASGDASGFFTTGLAFLRVYF